VVEDEPTFGMAVARRGWIELEGRFADGELLPLPPAGLASTAVRLRSLEELLHLSVDHGGLRGFFAKAKSYVSTQSRPWDSTGLARATDDPHIVRQWGHFTAQIDALTILYDEAVAETDATLDRGAAEPGPALTVARSYASSLAGPLISGVIEILGASATSDRHGFDRFWRDLTAHALDDPPLHNLEDIGRARIARRRPAVNKDRG
jgi:alkylation response protein AidB-like acyl-CoA dehydrogenase